jgi:hypothetical protein
LALAACGSAPPSRDELLARRRSENQRYFFIMGEGSGWHGYDTFKLAADGNAVYSFQREGWQELHFTIAPAAVAELQRRLEAGFFALEDRYDDREVMDGTQWFVKVRWNGRKKRVFCDNLFPDAIRALSAFVHESLLPTGRALERAPRVSDSEAWETDDFE